MAWNIDLPPAEWFGLDAREPQLTQLGNSLSACHEVALDTETTGLDKQNSLAVYWSLSWREEPHKIRRICLKSQHMGRYRSILRQDKRWLLANAKYDVSIVANTVGVVLGGEWCDVAVQHGLLYEDMDHGLKDIVKQLFGWSWRSFKETFGAIDKKNPHDSYASRMLRAEKEDLLRLVEYASNDAYGTLMSYEEQKRRMEARRIVSIYRDRLPTLWHYFVETELPFTKVLWLCERYGLGVDQEALHGMRTKVRGQLQVELRELYRLAQRPLNPYASEELVKYFHEHKGYKVKHFTKGGGSGERSPSTDKEALTDIWVDHRDPVAKQVLLCKSLNNTDNTFLKGIQKTLDPSGRTHTNFNQNGVVTGRLSSSDPNFQNIKHPDNDPFGIRSIIVSTLPGHCLLVADYSALEMMLLAEAARDERLLSIFDRGWDIHMGNASLVFGIPYEEMVEAKAIDKKVKEGKLPASAFTDRVKFCMRARQAVKAVGYGLNYGMKENKLAANLDISVEEAVLLMRKYMAAYPAVQRFFQEVSDELEEDGCVYSMLGRVRSLSEIASPIAFQRWRAGRQAANFIIQGSAAECAKMAMIRLHESDLYRRTGFILLSQIHDEIILEGPEENVVEASRIMAECMEHPLWKPLRVPLKASPVKARSWQDAK